jgi:hypothetical protein
MEEVIGSIPMGSTNHQTFRRITAICRRFDRGFFSCQTCFKCASFTSTMEPKSRRCQDFGQRELSRRCLDSSTFNFVRDGDTVFCNSMDRLARNLDALRRIVLGLTERGVHIVFVKENLTFTGEDSPMSNLLLSVIGAFAQFERELINERQREGIAIAKREGKHRGRKPSLTPARAAELRRRVAACDSNAALVREFGISRDSLYRYVPVKKRRAGKFGK